MNFFDDKLQGSAPISPLLPFFHSCDAFNLRSILEKKELLVTRCKVFKDEELLYLFYGKPAYKSHHTESTKLNAFLPVCFILDIDHIFDIKRIIPFDSGAFKKGLYDNFMHPGMTLELFYMRPEKRSIGKTINYFYESNKNYFMYQPKEQVPHDPLDFEIESYLSLIKGEAQSKADDRKACIEIQLGANINLNSGVLKAVILPKSFMLSPLVTEVLSNTLKAELITYESYGVGSNLYYAKILDLTRDYLKNHSLV